MKPDDYLSPLQHVAKSERLGSALSWLGAAARVFKRERQIKFANERAAHDADCFFQEVLGAESVIAGLKARVGELERDNRELKAKVARSEQDARLRAPTSPSPTRLERLSQTLSEETHETQTPAPQDPDRAADQHRVHPQGRSGVDRGAAPVADPGADRDRDRDRAPDRSELPDDWDSF